jgi:hypothetical protein
MVTREYLLVFFVGLCIQLPFFTFATASDYFDWKFPNFYFEFYVAATLAISLLSVQVYNWTVNNTSTKKSTYGSLGAIVLSLLLVPLLDIISQVWGGTTKIYFSLCIVASMISNLASAVGQVRNFTFRDPMY